MNNRANILYFLDCLADMSCPRSQRQSAAGLGGGIPAGAGGGQGQDHEPYIRMMQRDILRIVDACVPIDGSGAANLKVVKSVLEGFRQKGYLSSQTVEEIGEVLAERDVGWGMESVSAEPEEALPILETQNNNGDGLAEGQNRAKAVDHRLQTLSTTISARGSTSASVSPSQPSNSIPFHKLEKRLMEQRIEEDRERHKRLRENQWAINFHASDPNSTEDAEFHLLWDETSDLGSDDFVLFDEEAQEREVCARAHKEEVDGVGVGVGVYVA